MTSNEYYEKFRSNFPRTKEEFDHIVKDLILYTSDFTIDDNSKEYVVGRVFKTTYDSVVKVGDLVYSKEERDLLSNEYACKACGKWQAIKYEIPKPQVEVKEKKEKKKEVDGSIDFHEIKHLKKMNNCINIICELYQLNPEYLIKNLKTLRANMLLYEKVKEEIKDPSAFNSMWSAILMYGSITGHPNKRINSCVKRFHVNHNELEKYMRIKGGFKSKAI